MGLTKEQAAGIRQHRILELISEPGGASSNRMAKICKTTRGTILNDIKALKRKGYPIQASSMVTEDGMYVAVFEMQRAIRAASAERHS